MLFLSHQKLHTYSVNIQLRHQTTHFYLNLLEMLKNTKEVWLITLNWTQVVLFIVQQIEEDEAQVKERTDKKQQHRSRSGSFKIHICLVYWVVIWDRKLEDNMEATRNFGRKMRIYRPLNTPVSVVLWSFKWVQNSKKNMAYHKK